MEERTEELAGAPVRWWRAPAPDGGAGGANTLYLHDAPGSGAGWAPFLARHGGVAPDLPGFGQTGKGGQFAYDADGYGAWLQDFARHAGLREPFDLVLHGWGVVGLPWALADPGRVRRLVLLAPIPPSEDFRFGRRGRLWRRRVLGEWAMGFGFRPVFDRTLRAIHGGPLPDDFLDAQWRDFDPGTQRAILRLHRMAGPETLAALGSKLSHFPGPALVAWGAQDGDLDPGWAGVTAARLPGGEVGIVRGAGHWLWVDDAAVVDCVAGFLSNA